jgi:DNA-binding NtrC family response regulator
MRCNLPIILMTGQPKHTDAAQASEWHAFAYLAKPLTKHTLLRVIGEALARGRQRPDAATTGTPPVHSGSRRS